VKSNLEIIIKSVVTSIPEIAACHIFGSAARHEPVVNDLDILILTYPNQDADKTVWKALEKISDATGLPTDSLDILVFDLEMADPRVLYHAVSEGILIKNECPNLLGDKIEDLSRYFLENETIIQRAGRLNRELIEEICCNGQGTP